MDKIEKHGELIGLKLRKKGIYCGITLVVTNYKTKIGKIFTG